MPPDAAPGSAHLERWPACLNASIATSTPRPSVRRHDFRHRIARFKVNDMIGAHAARHLHPRRHIVHRDDRGGAREFRARRGAQSDRNPERTRQPCRRSAHLTAFRAREAGGHDVRAHQLPARPSIRPAPASEVGHRVGAPTLVFSLSAVDRVAELPAADRLKPVLRSRAVLAKTSAQARRGPARMAWIAPAITRWPSLKRGVNRRPKPLNNPDRFMPDWHRSWADRILAFEDMHIGAANRGRRDAHQCVEGARPRGIVASPAT